MREALLDLSKAFRDISEMTISQHEAHIPVIDEKLEAMRLATEKGSSSRPWVSREGLVRLAARYYRWA